MATTTAKGERYKLSFGKVASRFRRQTRVGSGKIVKNVALVRKAARNVPAAPKVSEIPPAVAEALFVEAAQAARLRALEAGATVSDWNEEGERVGTYALDQGQVVRRPLIPQEAEDELEVEF